MRRREKRIRGGEGKRKREQGRIEEAKLEGSRGGKGKDKEGRGKKEM